MSFIYEYDTHLFLYLVMYKVEGLTNRYNICAGEVDYVNFVKIL